MSTANQKPTESVSLNAFKQPKAFYLIFSIELWERFGYYGLQGIMAVYLVKQLGMSEADSITLFSSFSALVYGLVAIGGWLGDKVLGTKRVIMLGAIVLAIGYALVAWSGHDAGIVYMGMAAIAVGNGLFKANPASLLSKCYPPKDPRLDGAFTLFYMSINIGSLIALSLAPVHVTTRGRLAMRKPPSCIRCARRRACLIPEQPAEQAFAAWFLLPV